MTNLTSPNRILVVGPSWIGDMVMSQSLYKILKREHPHALIDVLAPEWTFSMLSRMPEVNQAIPMPIGHGALNLKERYRLAQKLKANKYDQAIVLPNSFKSALIPWLAGIPKRTGWRGEFRYGLLNDIRKLDESQYPLMIEQYMALGLPAGALLPLVYPYPELKISSATQEAVLKKFKPRYRGKPILGISPGAAFGPSKRWPETYFANVAKQKLSEGWDIWLFGAKDDAPLIEVIQSVTQNQCESFAGKTELAETIDLVSLTSGLVTNDSGLMHIAAALEKPVIAIYGSTSPEFTPPLSKQASVVKLNLACQPCFQRECPLVHHKCMRDLLPALVIDKMNKWES